MQRLLSTCKLLLVAALFPVASEAQSVTISPHYGKPTSHFTVSTTVCVLGNQPFLWVDGHKVEPPHGGELNFPVSLDSLYGLSPGVHEIKVGFVCDDPPPTSGFAYDFVHVSVHPPVLLVHGFCGSPATWNSFEPVLVDSGFSVARIDFDMGERANRPAEYVPALEAQLAAMDTDDGQISIVAHSLGGLVTREYLRHAAEMGLATPITKVVTLGTPHHGSDLIDWFLPAVEDIEHALLQSSLTLPLASIFDDLLGCRGDLGTRACLEDLRPGSDFLNTLNYGNSVDAYDQRRISHGWSGHQPETALLPSTYYASIAGIGGCSPLWVPGSLTADFRIF